MSTKRWRDARRRTLDNCARARGEERRDRARCAVRTALTVRQILSERRGPQWLIEQVRAKHAAARLEPGQDVRFAQLCAVMIEQAPRLISPQYVEAAFQLASAAWVRPLEEWRPSGRGRDTQFRSLCAHLLALYPLPSFLWSVFTEPDADVLVPIVAELGRGGSFHKLVKAGALPVPLSKRQCHEVLQAHSGSTLLGAIRRVQVSTEGGSERLLSVWLTTPPGRAIAERAVEEFWLTVLRLFARAPMSDMTEVGPLVDYLAERRRADAGFSMKGRTLAALMRGMHEWHRELRQTRAARQYRYPQKFEPSGFHDGVYDQSKRDRRTGNHVRRVWHIREILTPVALQQEGRDQRHCVYSYGAAIVSGQTSIWSMTLDHCGKPERLLTIEVRNRERSVVQVRGYRNRLPTNEEHRMVMQWAVANRLRVQ